MHKKRFFEKKMNNILILNIEKKYQMTARNLPGYENYTGQIGTRIPIRIKRFEIFGEFQYHSL